MSRTLFVLKYRALPYEYSEQNSVWGEGDIHSLDKPLHSGLYNSARFMCDMLVNNGLKAKLVHVIDNNAIHKEIVAFSDFVNNDPVTEVIIEAFWVVPEKFDVLRAACPYVKRWIVRNHSETPFLANEGMAFDWIMQYIEKDVAVSCNAPRMLDEVRNLIKIRYPEWTDEKIISLTPYLPNFYPLDGEKYPRKERDEYLDVGCFGAVRPLKNTMLQAIAALQVANHQGKKLRFHINGGRLEMGGSPILRNLHKLFEHYPDHELISHGWKPHHEFLKLVASMDIVAQCSISETFNIVGADAVSQGVPVILSDEIPWSNKWFNATPLSSRSIVFKMILALWIDRVFKWNPHLSGLKAYNNKTTLIWIRYLNS